MECTSICAAFVVTGARVGRIPETGGWDEGEEEDEKPELLLSHLSKTLSKVKKAENELVKILEDASVPHQAASRCVCVCV